METTKKESSTRWWEFYAVRYAMGTVVGAIIVYILCRANGTLQPLLFQPGGNIDSGATRLMLLAAYGLVYCYVASAPILVFHSARFLLKLDTTWLAKFKSAGICLSVPAVVAVLTYVCLSRTGVDKIPLYSAAVFVIGLVLWLQLLGVYLTLVRSTDLYCFYERLANRRQGENGDITDSYRHLREHGNSFFIVVLEVLLGTTLYALGMFGPETSDTSGKPASALTWQLAIIVGWILPAAFVWLIGTVIERRFSDSQAQPTSAPPASP